MIDKKSMRVFFEIHDGNPQEGPGDTSSTRKAFTLMKDLPPAPRILDVGCGPGRQTLELCKLTDGHMVAADFHLPYLKALKRRSDEPVPPNRLSLLQADMADLSFKSGTFDAVWSEGAIYIIGFKAGLKTWKSFLKKGGYIAVTEVSWLQSDPPEELTEFWNEAYPQIQTIQDNLADLSSCGYRSIGYFVLPESAWWNYYHPIEKRVGVLKEKYKNDNRASAVLDMELEEMELYRKYSDYYGYVFYVGQTT